MSTFKVTGTFQEYDNNQGSIKISVSPKGPKWPHNPDFAFYVQAFIPKSRIASKIFSFIYSKLLRRPEKPRLALKLDNFNIYLPDGTIPEQNFSQKVPTFYGNLLSIPKILEKNPLQDQTDTITGSFLGEITHFLPAYGGSYPKQGRVPLYFLFNDSITKVSLDAVIEADKEHPGETRDEIETRMGEELASNFVIEKFAGPFKDTILHYEYRGERKYHGERTKDFFYNPKPNWLNSLENDFNLDSETLKILLLGPKPQNSPYLNNLYPFRADLQRENRPVRNPLSAYLRDFNRLALIFDDLFPDLRQPACYKTVERNSQTDDESKEIVYYRYLNLGYQKGIFRVFSWDYDLVRQYLTLNDDIEALEKQLPAHPDNLLTLCPPDYYCLNDYKPPLHIQQIISTTPNDQELAFKFFQYLGTDLKGRRPLTNISREAFGRLIHHFYDIPLTVAQGKEFWPTFKSALPKIRETELTRKTIYSEVAESLYPMVPIKKGYHLDFPMGTNQLRLLALHETDVLENPQPYLRAFSEACPRLEFLFNYVEVYSPFDKHPPLFLVYLGNDFDKPINSHNPLKDKIEGLMNNPDKFDRYYKFTLADDPYLWLGSGCNFGCCGWEYFNLPIPVFKLASIETTKQPKDTDWRSMI